MKRVILLGCAAFYLAVVGKAQAQSYSFSDSVLTFGPTWLQYPYTLFSEWPPHGNTDEARVLGVLTAAKSPFDDIVEGTSELTYVISGLVYDYSSAWDGLYMGGYDFNFKDGIFRLYSDPTPDADLSNPSTYEDGELLLEGNVAYYDFQNCQGGNCSNAGLQHGNVVFTGGSLFSRINPDDAWLIWQIWSNGTPYLSEDSLSQFPTQGALLHLIPLKVQATTWGRIKSRFHPE